MIFILQRPPEPLNEDIIPGSSIAVQADLNHAAARGNPRRETRRDAGLRLTFQ
jgi:hypothetical protein